MNFIYEAFVKCPSAVPWVASIQVNSKHKEWHGRLRLLLFVYECLAARRVLWCPKIGDFCLIRVLIINLLTPCPGKVQARG